MEPRTYGGVTKRLETLREACLTWLQWEDKQGEPKIEQEDFLLQLAENGTELVYPESLKQYRRFRKYGIPTYSGGMFNQPHIQLLEFDACESAIAEHEQIRIVNALNKAGKQPTIGGDDA